MDLEEFLSENGIPSSPSHHHHNQHQPHAPPRQPPIMPQAPPTPAPSVMDLSNHASTSIHTSVVSPHCLHSSPARAGKAKIHTHFYTLWYILPFPIDFHGQASVDGVFTSVLHHLSKLLLFVTIIINIYGYKHLVGSVMERKMTNCDLVSFSRRKLPTIPKSFRVFKLAWLFGFRCR